LSICNLLCRKFAASVRKLQILAQFNFLNHNIGAISCATRREPLTLTDDRHTDQATAKCVAIGGITCAQCLKCKWLVTAQALLGPTCLKILRKVSGLNMVQILVPPRYQISRPRQGSLECFPGRRAH